MANIITGCRMLFSILLFFVTAFSPWFYSLYLICGVTDMVDGAIARKTNTVSELGSRLDTLADLLFTAVCLVKLLPAVELPPWLWLWIAVIAGIKAVNFLSGFLLQGKFVAEHTIMNKTAGLLLFLLPLTLSFIDLSKSAAVVCVVAAFAAVQEGHLIRTGRRAK